MPGMPCAWFKHSETLCDTSLPFQDICRLVLAFLREACPETEMAAGPRLSALLWRSF